MMTRHHFSIEAGAVEKRPASLDPAVPTHSELRRRLQTAGHGTNVSILRPAGRLAGDGADRVAGGEAPEAWRKLPRGIAIGLLLAVPLWVVIGLAVAWLIG